MYMLVNMPRGLGLMKCSTTMKCARVVGPWYHQFGFCENSQKIREGSITIQA